MCVISYSKIGVDIPTDEQIRKMFTQNPDGAGIMIDEGNGRVSYQKGFMKVGDFIEAVHNLKEKRDLKELNVAFHFRIGTAGKNDCYTTHPFMLSPRYQDLRVQSYTGSVPVMMHNGVISGYGKILDPLSSDTQDFAGTVGHSMLRKNGKHKPSKALQKVAEKISGSCRVLIFYGDNEPIKFGTWQTLGEIEFSNLNWNSTYSTVGSRSGWSNYGVSSSTNYGLEPDEWGMWENVYPLVGRDWIQFDSHKDLEAKMAGYIKTEYKDGSIMWKNKYNDSLCYEELPDANEIVTPKGMKDRTDMLDYYDALESDDSESYIEFQSVDDAYEFVEDMRWEDSHYINPEGKNFYIDWTTMEGYTDAGLKILFADNWKYARRDLMEYQTFTVEWSDIEPDSEDLKAWQQAIKKKLTSSQTSLIEAEVGNLA